MQQATNQTLSNKEMAQQVRAQLKAWVGVEKKETHYTHLRRIEDGKAKPGTVIAFAQKHGYTGGPNRWTKQ